MSKTRLMTMVVGLMVIAIAAPAFADRHQRRERREERRERREERREDRRERRVERRVERHDRFRPDRAPPAIRVERHNPRRGYVWVGGQWNWNGGQWVWSGGRYERERRGHRWRPARWEQRDGAYVSVDGGWIMTEPVIAPPRLREERWAPRGGFVWIRGHYDWRDGQWAWVGGHYERERAGYIWREPRYEQRDGVYVTVQGSWVVR
jgi:hypothetical protein